MRMMRHDMERACDASVLRYLSASEKIEYGDTLIRMSELAPSRTLLVQHASVVGSRSQLKSRINMIAQHRPGGASSSLLAGLLITLTSSIAVTQAASPPQQPEATVAQPAPSAERQAASAPEATVPPQPTPATQAESSARQSRTIEPRTADRTPALESADFQIKYPKAELLVAFIKSAPGVGLVSENGSIAVDEKTNTILVRDIADNIATIRELVAKLDVPIQQVLVSAVVAMVDNDLLQELTASQAPGGSWSPFTVLGSDQDVTAALDAGREAQRAEIISSPRWVVANRTRASLAQTTGAPLQRDPAGESGSEAELSLAVTPNVGADDRVMLDIDATVTVKSGTGVMMPGGSPVPAIDSTQVKTQVVLAPGATVMVNVMEGGTGGVTRPGRRLVAFVTPTLLADPPAPNR
jgi:type IV pilus assembly protein PilQ